MLQTSAPRTTFGERRSAWRLGAVGASPQRLLSRSDVCIQGLLDENPDVHIYKEFIEKPNEIQFILLSRLKNNQLCTPQDHRATGPQGGRGLRNPRLPRGGGGWGLQHIFSDIL